MKKKTVSAKGPRKILITEIDPKVWKQTGLYDEGCYGSTCADECCEWGCDVDLATLRLIYRHRDKIEPLVKARIEDCFSTPLKEDDDYVGGAYRETAVRKKDSTCAFRLPDTKGCALFYLWAVKGLPKRIVPTICRVYPLTWHRGRLFIDTPLRKACKCKEKPSAGFRPPSLMETQEKEVRALFEIRERKQGAPGPGRKAAAKKAGSAKK